MHWKKKLILLTFFCNLAFAEEAEVVSPIIERYNKNHTSILNQKKKKIDRKKQNNLYFNNKDNEQKTKSSLDEQTSSSYFVRTNEIREANGNLSTSNIGNAVLDSLEKPANNEEYDGVGKKIKDFTLKGFDSAKSTVLSVPIFFQSLLSKANDEEVNSRPTGVYKGFLASFMMAGTTNIAGNEDRPNGTGTPSVANGQWTNYNTFSTTKVYLPSIELGIFAGWQINSYFRSQIDATWTYMYGNLGNVFTNQSANPGSKFNLQPDAFDGHLFASTFNIYFDPYRNLKIWPTIGGGAGAAMFLFNNYNNTALVYPLVNLYVGFNFMLPDKKEIISIGYKLQWILTGTAHNKSPVQDLNSSTTNLIDSRPTNQDEAVFAGIWIHKIEIAIRLY